MKPIAPIAAALTLALAACSGEADAPSDGADVELTVSTTDNPNGSDDAAGVVAPMQTPAAIPTQFLGVWDYVNGTCNPASDMRLDISENRIQFYESVGTVSEAREDDGTTYVDLAMTAEGENWTTSLGLRLFDAGTTLMVIHPEAPDDAEKHLRKRCDA